MSAACIAGQSLNDLPNKYNANKYIKLSLFDRYCIAVQCQRRSSRFSTVSKKKSFPVTWLPYVGDTQVPEFMTDSLIPFSSAKDIPKRTWATQLFWAKQWVRRNGTKSAHFPTSQWLHPDKLFTHTMVFLAQQVFCGWKEHFHEFRNLPDDMNCTQCRLSTQKKTLNEGNVQTSSNCSAHTPTFTIHQNSTA